MSRLSASVVACLLVAPAIALAEPATIRVFEAKVHASANAASPVVHVFAEGAAVSVSETTDGGWRRVRLPDGGVGYVLESELAFSRAPAPAAQTPAPAVATTPASVAAPAVDLRPRLYVKDLAHLAQLMKDDPDLGSTASSLDRRRTQSMAVAIVGGLAAGVLIVGGGVKTATDTNSDVNSPDFGRRTSSAGPIMLGAGAAVALGSVIYVAARYPRRSEVIDVLNAWNTRYPDRQFQVDRVVDTVRGDQLPPDHGHHGVH